MGLWHVVVEVLQLLWSHMLHCPFALSTFLYLLLVAGASPYIAKGNNPSLPVDAFRYFAAFRWSFLRLLLLVPVSVWIYTGSFNPAPYYNTLLFASLIPPIQTRIHRKGKERASCALI